MINPALIVAMSAQSGDHATRDTVIARLRKAGATSATTAVLLDPATDPELQALTDLCQAMLSSNEFLYVD